MVAQENDTNIIQYTHIGIFHTDYTPATGAPRQGILMPETKGTIEIFPQYHSALNTLNRSRTLGANGKSACLKP